MGDQRAPCLRTLLAVDRPRSYWSGLSPDDPSERWYFEVVEERGDFVAVRQVSVDGAHVLGYSVDHLEDVDGFLTDRPIEPLAWGLERVTAADFDAAWIRRSNR